MDARAVGRSEDVAAAIADEALKIVLRGAAARYERRRSGSAEVWRSLDGAAFAAPLFKATVQPKFVCTLINIRMRNLVGVAMPSLWRSGS